MKQIQTIKKLNTQLNSAIADAEAFKVELANKQREYQNKMEIISIIRSKIDELNADKTIRVSEHALLRYFERVLGYDLEEIKSSLITDELRNYVETLGDSGKFPVKIRDTEYKVVMIDYTIVTIDN